MASLPVDAQAREAFFRDRERIVNAIACPQCGAAQGEQCQRPSGRKKVWWCTARALALAKREVA